MKVKYEATIKLIAIGEIESKEDLIDNPKEEFDLSTTHTRDFSHELVVQDLTNIK